MDAIKFPDNFLRTEPNKATTFTSNITMFAGDFIDCNMFQNLTIKKISIDVTKVPDKSIIVTLTNSYTFELMIFSLIRLKKSTPEIGSTLVIVNMDHLSYEACSSLNYENCVLGVRHDLKPSDFKQSDYNSMIYCKWHIMKYALESFEFVFIFDTDVVIFRNPWTLVLHDIDKYDLRYQLEDGRRKDGRESLLVNSGQMLFRRSEASLATIDYVISKESGDRESGDRESGEQLDQDHVLEAANKSNATTLPLSTQYSSYCWDSQRLCKSQTLTSFHANCAGGLKDKLMVLENAMTTC